MKADKNLLSGSTTLLVLSLLAAAAEVTLIFDRYGENTVFLTIPLKGGAGHG